MNIKEEDDDNFIRGDSDMFIENMEEPLYDESVGGFDPFSQQSAGCYIETAEQCEETKSNHEERENLHDYQPI